MTLGPRTLHVTIGVIFLTASGVADAESGAHRKATARLLAVFEELESQLAVPEEGQSEPQKQGVPRSSKHQASTGELSRATLGTGCFWCTEAVFQQLRGVKRVVSGYSGGRVPNPTYHQVGTGLTGHAEVIHVEFDPKVISYAKLLEVFWITHDPTTLNRQGVDVGPQYRSAIFYHDDQQRDLAERYKAKLNQSRVFRNPVVTEITRFEKFYPAEGYHQNYFDRNGRQPYCQSVIRPKLTRLRKLFRDDLKPDAKN